MKARINYKSKKTIIIIAIAVVLLIAAITGTVAFIKGNNNAAAAMENTEVTEPANNGNDSNNNGGVENPNTPNTDNPEQIPIIDDNQNPTTPAQNGDTTTNPGTTTNQGTTTGTTTGNAGTTVPDTEYTQTTVVENPWKTEDITWAPISLQARTETAGLNINTPDLEVTKTAYVGNQEITAEPTNTVVQYGQEITYVIRIKNTGNLLTPTIRTIDAIPEGTELIEKTISEGGELVNGKITWKNVISAGETVELSFKVKVISEKEITLISNTAKVNGEDTPTTETPVVTTAKEAYLVVDGEFAKATSAKVGDTLKYVITIANNSNVPGKTTVTDIIPDGTTFVERSINVNDKNTDYTAENLKDGIKVEVPANGMATVSFDVVINKETATGEVVKEVTNAAVVGEKETPPAITPVANITGAKSVDKSTAKVGDTLTYTITLTNSGNGNGTVTVTDEIPEGTSLVAGLITGNGSYNEKNRTITWTDIEVKAGDTVEVSFKVIINSDTKTSVTNTAVIDGNKPTKEVETTVANITGAKSVDKSTAKVGDTLTYTITLTNSGNGNGTVTVTDEIPEGTSLVAGLITGNGSYNEKNRTITWTDIEVKAGDTVEVSFKVIINSDTKTSVTNTAVIDGNKPTKEVETKVANITTVKTSVGEHADGTPVTDENPLHELDKITYTLTATNSGNAEGTVILTDAIPEGTTLNSITGDGVESNGTITWNVVVPAKEGEVDGKVEVSFTVTINPFESETKTIVNDQAKQDGKPTNSTTDTAEKVYVDITVNKTWDDNETQANRRPSQIRFELYDDNSTQPLTHYDMNTTKREDSCTFAKQPKYNSDGTTITYTVQEKEINTNDLKFYQSEHSESTDNNGNKTYNFTNKFQKPIDTKKVTVTKIWQDNSDAAQKRPTSVTLQLNNQNVELTSNDAVLNDGNTWSTEMTVDVYNDNGEEIEYTATESVVPQWYEKAEQGTTVTNTFKAPTDIKYDITLTKIWYDNNNEANKRPTSVKFDLYKIDVDGETEILVESGIELKGNSNEWTITENVQKYDEKANEIKYFVKEEATGSIFYIKDDKDPTDLTITNKFSVPEDKAVVSVKKVWNDNNNLAKRETVTIRVTGNGKSQDIVLTSENANATDGNVWEKNNVKTDLLKYDNLGNEVKYTFDEVNIPDGYIKTVNDNEITNSLPGIKVTKTVSKVQDIDAKEMNGITVKKDDVIEYEITVENIGTIPLNNLKVTDNLNVYLDKDHPETTTNVLAENETLNANETKTYTVYYKVTAEDAKSGSQLLTNTATANAKYTDSNNKEQTVEDKDNADVTIQDMPGIEIIKTQKVNGNDATDATKVQPGDEIEYTITVTNTGNTVLNEVTVTDSMSTKEGFEITKGSLNIGTLGIAPNNIATITAKYTVQESDMKETESKIENVATVVKTSPSTEPKKSEVDVTTIAWKADITLSKSGELADGTDANGSTVEYGEKITYVLSAKNDGNATGTATIKDSTLKTLIDENKVKDVTKIIIKDYDDNGNARTTEKDYNEVISGVKVNVPAGKTATVEFTVTATAKPGDSISNGVEGGNTEVVTPVVKTIKTKSNTGNVVGANYVLIIDTSSSMKKNIDSSTTRISAAQEAIKDLAKFLFENDPETTSKLSIVQFNSDSEVADVEGQTVFGASDYKNRKIDQLIKNITISRGTNIQAGLEKAGDLLYNTSTGIHAKGLTTNSKDVIILLSDGEPSKGERSADGLGKIAKEQLNQKGDNITNDIYCIAFGNEISTETLQQISSGKVYSSTNKESLFESFKNIIYEAEDPVEKTLAQTTQVIYTGEKEISSDKAVTITYDGQEDPLEYVITQEGTTEDGVLTYKKEDDGKYSLTFNLTDALLDKNNIVITYYVK